MILLSLAHLFLRMYRGQCRNIILMLILLTCFFTEAILIWCKVQNVDNGIFTTLSIVVHDTLWFCLLTRYFGLRYLWMLLSLFFVTAFLNLFSVEGLVHFNYMTFVAGALIYVVVFIRESIDRLKNEALSFMVSNNYLLLCAPLLFFLSLSLLFGFKSKTLTTLPVIGSVILYQIVIYFVNLIYYSIINIHLYQTKHNPYAQ